MPLKRFVSPLILFLILPLVSFTGRSSVSLIRIKTIVIDAGHGGIFPGASGKYSREQDVTLKVALRLGKAIEQSMKDVRVIYTRRSDTQLASRRELDLRERINIANRADADLWISIHCNAPGKAGGRNTKGVETYVAGFDRLNEQKAAIGEFALLKEEYKINEKLDRQDPETAILLSMKSNDLRKKSILLASLIQDEYVAAGRLNRGFQEQSLAVLRTATMPAVLTEIGFITNPQEEDYINSDTGQAEIVNCLLKAIKAYQLRSAS